MGGMGNCNPIEVTQGNTLEILLDKEKINNKYSQAFLKATISSESSGNLSVIYNNGMIDTLVEIEPSYLKLEQNTLSREIILSLMQDTSMIKLSSSGTDIKIENIEVFTSLPMACSNDLLSFKNEKMGNIVKGDVELKNNGYLMMPIVYEAGWHVYVDGTEKNILRANFGLSAVEIKEGLHSVVFEYRSPILGIAIVLTCIGWGCSVGILFWSLYKKYKK